MHAVIHLRRLQMLFGIAYVARLDVLKYVSKCIYLFSCFIRLNQDSELPTFTRYIYTIALEWEGLTITKYILLIHPFISDLFLPHMTNLIVISIRISYNSIHRNLL